MKEPRKTLMKIVVKIQDVVELAQRFERSPKEAWLEVRAGMQHAAKEVLERVMQAEVALFLGRDSERTNKRNGYRVKRYAIKGMGTLELCVPRDRAGRFESAVVPLHRRYDEALERDLALLHLAGLSTRMLSMLSSRVLGMRVSAQEVSTALYQIVPKAKAFLERRLDGRRFKYLYIDGTYFRVRRTTVEREPRLIVVGVDEHDCKSVLAMAMGDKDAKGAWEQVFSELIERGLDAHAVTLGVMDGLPGLSEAFKEAFTHAKVARCWVHKMMNVMSKTPVRYQALVKAQLHAVAYAQGRAEASAAFEMFKAQWSKTCPEAVHCVEKDLDALLVHYDFPSEHWDALRTTNPIERVNKEFKRRAKSMDGIGPEGLNALLTFTALKLEFNWTSTPITSKKLLHLRYRQLQTQKRLEHVQQGLLN